MHCTVLYRTVFYLGMFCIYPFFQILFSSILILVFYSAALFWLKSLQTESLVDAVHGLCHLFTQQHSHLPVGELGHLFSVWRSDGDIKGHPCPRGLVGETDHHAGERKSCSVDCNFGTLKSSIF